MRRPHLSVTLALLTSVASAVGADAVATRAADDVGPVAHLPASWDSFVMLVWQADTDASRDRALYESVNLHGFHIDRRDGHLRQFADESKWPFYVDHAADRGWLHLDEGVAEQLQRKPGIQVRPHSFADPQTIDEMHGFLRENVGAAKGSSAVGYAFDDEIGTGFFCSPIETDGHPLSVAAWRKELAGEYGSIGRLDAEWGASFKDFAEVQPRSFEAFRGQVTKGGVATMNLAPWCDWHEHMDTQFADMLAELTRFTNGLDASVPAGFVGAQPPNAFGGYDFRKVCKAVQWMECYDIGGSNEILKSFWDQRRPHVQTFFSSGDARTDSWFLWYYLCHGDRGVICWPKIESKGIGWFAGGKVADFLSANAETFKEVQGPVSQTIIDGEAQFDPVAIYYSQPSIQVSWALDVACHGQTWPNRLSAMDHSCSTSAFTRVGWIKTLEDAGIQARFVHQDHLLGGELEKRQVKVLILPQVLCLSDAEAAAIRTFAAQGGTVIADHCCGLFDEHGKARAAGALDDLFDVKRDLAKGWLNGEELTEVDGEQEQHLSPKNWAVGAPRHLGVAVYERGLAIGAKATSDKAGDIPVVVRNGKAIYLNLSPIGYALNRSGGEVGGWRDLIASLVAEAGVTPRLRIAAGGEPAPRMESLFWKNQDRTTVCVLKNIDRAASVDAFGATAERIGDAAAKITLTFAAPVKDLRNERTGKAMGSGTMFEDDFTPWQANVYSYAH